MNCAFHGEPKDTKPARRVQTAHPRSQPLSCQSYLLPTSGTARRFTADGRRWTQIASSNQGRLITTIRVVVAAPLRLRGGRLAAARYPRPSASICGKIPLACLCKVLNLRTCFPVFSLRPLSSLRLKPTGSRVTCWFQAQRTPGLGAPQARGRGARAEGQAPILLTARAVPDKSDGPGWWWGGLRRGSAVRVGCWCRAETS